jgi:hypothetical protein
MAIEALVNFGKPFKHSACHDLESLLYVIIYLCTYTTGPCEMQKKFPPSMTISLAHWFRKDYVKEIGWTKAGHIMMAEDTIIFKFDEYWSVFAPFIQELIETCFPNNPSKPNMLTHATMLAILERAFATAGDDDCAESTNNGKWPRLGGNSGVPLPRKGDTTLP